MKLLIEKIFRKLIPLKVRNSFKIFPSLIIKSRLPMQSSTSDAFFWRTDNNFSTKFTFSDIINNILEKKNSYIVVNFFNASGLLIKKIKLNELKTINSLIIDKKLLDGTEDYGTFYIYHVLDKFSSEDKIMINNKCYTGYSKDGILYSYVHGNIIGKTFDFKNKKFLSISDISFFENYKYKISKPFKIYDYNEILIANPTDYLIKGKINNKKFYINPNGSIKLNVNDVTLIKSNYPNLRPIAFSYNKDFFDPYHC